MHAPQVGDGRDRPAPPPPEAGNPLGEGDLTGRDAELLGVERFLSRAAGAGEVLVVTGPLGIGKSAVLHETVVRAGRAGFRVVRGTGHRAEADVPGAGLTQLLPHLPAPGRADHHPDGDALATRIVAAAEDHLAAGTALVQALFGRTGTAADTDAAAAAGGAAPLLIALDDAQWFDTTSLKALTSAVRGTRRPVALVIATRHGDRRDFARRSPQLRLGPLAPADAERLLDAQVRFLPARLRSRVLAEAGGNPAGIIGIAGALRDAGAPAASLLAPRLPLGERLQRTVCSLLDRAPAAARDFLLLAAVSHTDRVDVLLAAARAGGHGTGGMPAARRAGLVAVADGRLRFTHPLLPAALHWSASPGQRLPAHLALAEVHTGRPYLRALHAAAAATGPDEATAAALEAGAPADLPQAVAALERAADLSPTGQGRAARLVKAAHAADLCGQVSVLRHLVGRLMAGPLPASLTAEACALEARVAYLTDGVPEHALSVLSRSAAAPSTRRPAPFVAVAHALAPALFRPTVEQVLRPALEAELAEPGRADDPEILSALCWTDRGAYGARARPLLAAAAARHGSGAAPENLPHDAARDVAHVVMATALDDPVAADLISGHLLDAQAESGHFGPALTVLVHRQIAHLHLGLGPAVRRDAELGRRWAGAAQDTPAQVALRAGLAQAQAWTGEEEGHQTVTDEVLAYALPRRLQILAARARWARGLMALVHGRPEDAVEELRMLATDSGDAWHPVVAHWALGDYVAAAVATGRADEVHEPVRRAAEVDRRLDSPLLGLLVARSRALLSEGEEAERHFRAALTARGEPLRYERARTELAFGQWLRRQRRVLEARTHLQEAHDAFTALGADAWAHGAASELIAAGEATTAPPVWAARFHLTPREAEVAALAADGLTNQRIAWQLGLTHRTVASHLSRVFMKVGVSSRGQLPSVLGP
ncbi:AAA family ATPase [Streptomyces longispororuber]|uniref:AAA family ATPase n=1 Tax=Streptomyces longispororuber TaxID=68230 RepID=UPI00210E14BD|nr:LuxR family transcriptional regulator [Streptomyces longispororuber]MCQ4207694.1 AAA family ATPase [Streptomyces longispororuber]